MLTPERIKEIRLGLALTQVNLAKLLDVSVRAIQAWEAGASKINPCHAFLLTLLDLYGVLWLLNLRKHYDKDTKKTNAKTTKPRRKSKTKRANEDQGSKA